MLRSSALLLLLSGLQLAAAVANPRECFLQPSSGAQAAWPCKSTTKCYLQHLGEPKTLGEWWMAYASAVTEYCSALDASGHCSQDDLCQVIRTFPIGPWQGQPMSSGDADQYEGLVGEAVPFECWPDWERILRHPCIGCEDYQMFRCANATQQTDCEELSEYCQLWPKTRASSLQPYCWPKWLLHDMLVNRTKFMQYTKPPQDYPSQAETKSYADHVLSSSYGIQIWSAVSFELEHCGHKQYMDLLLSQLASSATSDFGSDVGDILLREWHVPCMTGTLSDALSRYHAYPYADTNRDTVWPYLTWSYQSSESLPHSAALFHVHQHLSMPWTRLPGFLDMHSGWQHRLSAANTKCANITDPVFCNPYHAASGPWESADTIMHVMQGYCSVAFSSSCNVSNFTHTTFSCDVPHERPQLALGVIWLVFGIVMVVIIVLVEFAWSIAGTLRRFTVDTQCAKWRLIGCGGFSKWLQRRPVCYHPTVVPNGRGRSAPAGVALWRRVLVRLNNYVLGGAYVADIALDIATLATLFRYCDPYMWWSVTNQYGVLLLCVFLTQYFLGAVLAAPAVLATHGWLSYTWFEMTPRLRVLLLLPPVWVILASVFVLFSAFVVMVGMWYLMVADFNMLLTLVGVPPRWLLGNKLNMEAVLLLRFLCEGIVEALPSALISTSILNSQLLKHQDMGWRYVVFWLSLVSSLVRVGREVYKLVRLTYDLHACCFVTAIVDVCYHLQLHPVNSLLVSSTTPCVPHASSGKNNSMLVETRRKDITTNITVPSSSNSTKQESGSAASFKDGSRGVVTSIEEVGGGTTTVASTLDQVLPQPPSITLVDGVSRRSARGCCWPGTIESDKVHPRALVIYVWVWLFLILSGVAVICTYVICPDIFLGGVSCGAESLVSVWSNFGNGVETPRDALACLTKSST